MKHFYLFTVIIVALLLPQSIRADEKKVTKDGFETTVYWFKNKDILKVDGTVKGKYKKCGNLNITIFMFNKKTQGIERFDTTIEDYTGRRHNDFEAQVKLYSREGHTGDWYLKNIFYDCL